MGKEKRTERFYQLLEERKKAEKFFQQTAWKILIFFSQPGLVRTKLIELLFQMIFILDGNCAKCLYCTNTPCDEKDSLKCFSSLYFLTHPFHLLYRCQWFTSKRQQDFSKVKKQIQNILKSPYF